MDSCTEAAIEKATMEATGSLEIAPMVMTASVYVDLLGFYDVRHRGFELLKICFHFFSESI